MTEIRLSPQQLNELELMRAGAYGHALRYELPTKGPHNATLRLAGAVDERALTLLDTEATPVARVRVLETSADSRGTWIGGLVEVVREPAPAAFSELRPSRTAEPLSDATLLLGRRSGRLDGTVIVTDTGDAHALAQIVRGLRTDGLRVRVLPEPAADHVPAGQRGELLEHLASIVFASNVKVIRGEQKAPGNGIVVLFTGLSGSGKSTIARQVTRRLRAESSQRVTLLDGDEVRAMLSAGLGFSREDRELNVRRIGWVASQISAHGGIAICAPIAPYESMRREVREMAERVGRFVLVHVATPLEECEARDRKGLYAKARAGEIMEFTGISDPYETPELADVTVGAHGERAESAADRVTLALVGESELGYVI
ncbi:adenylyl-sulfate kinase [Demequina sp. NBRC 110056]|uniref:adenylyl-sulfate kinase n=1 Tax=Demequina sp. NBRC 110056 TaxID=1570345 RepID=UPI001F3274E4|nr:adenylyl-sulfate kinase [Demequina sp. NBRC 110056]